jgi:hypothetical protein
VQKSDKATVFILNHNEDQSDIRIEREKLSFEILNNPRYIIDSRQNLIVIDGIEFQNIGCFCFNF